MRTPATSPPRADPSRSPGRLENVPELKAAVPHAAPLASFLPCEKVSSAVSRTRRSPEYELQVSSCDNENLSSANVAIAASSNSLTSIISRSGCNSMRHGGSGVADALLSSFSPVGIPAIDVSSMRQDLTRIAVGSQVAQPTSTVGRDAEKGALSSDISAEWTNSTATSADVANRAMPSPPQESLPTHGAADASRRNLGRVPVPRAGGSALQGPLHSGRNRGLSGVLPSLTSGTGSVPSGSSSITCLSSSPPTSNISIVRRCERSAVASDAGEVPGTHHGLVSAASTLVAAAKKDQLYPSPDVTSDALVAPAEPVDEVSRQPSHLLQDLGSGLSNRGVEARTVALASLSCENEVNFDASTASTSLCKEARCDDGAEGFSKSIASAPFALCASPQAEQGRDPADVPPRNTLSPSAPPVSIIVPPRPLTAASAAEVKVTSRRTRGLRLSSFILDPSAQRPEVVPPSSTPPERRSPKHQPWGHGHENPMGGTEADGCFSGRGGNEAQEVPATQDGAQQDRSHGVRRFPKPLKLLLVQSFLDGEAAANESTAISEPVSGTADVGQTVAPVCGEPTGVARNSSGNSAGPSCSASEALGPTVTALLSRSLPLPEELIELLELPERQQVEQLANALMRQFFMRYIVSSVAGVAPFGSSNTKDTTVSLESGSDGRDPTGLSSSIGLPFGCDFTPAEVKSLCKEAFPLGKGSLREPTSVTFLLDLAAAVERDAEDAAIASLAGSASAVGSPISSARQDSVPRRGVTRISCTRQFTTDDESGQVAAAAAPALCAARRETLVESLSREALLRYQTETAGVAPAEASGTRCSGPSVQVSSKSPQASTDVESREAINRIQGFLYRHGYSIEESKWEVAKALVRQHMRTMFRRCQALLQKENLEQYLQNLLELRRIQTDPLASLQQKSLICDAEGPDEDDDDLLLPMPSFLQVEGSASPLVEEVQPQPLSGNRSPHAMALELNVEETNGPPKEEVADESGDRDEEGKLSGDVSEILETVSRLKDLVWEMFPVGKRPLKRGGDLAYMFGEEKAYVSQVPLATVDALFQKSQPQSQHPVHRSPHLCSESVSRRSGGFHYSSTAGRRLSPPVGEFSRGSPQQYREGTAIHNLPGVQQDEMGGYSFNWANPDSRMTSYAASGAATPTTNAAKYHAQCSPMEMPVLHSSSLQSGFRVPIQPRVGAYSTDRISPKLRHISLGHESKLIPVATQSARSPLNPVGLMSPRKSPCVNYSPVRGSGQVTGRYSTSPVMMTTSMTDLPLPAVKRSSKILSISHSSNHVASDAEETHLRSVAESSAILSTGASGVEEGSQAMLDTTPHTDTLSTGQSFSFAPHHTSNHASPQFQASPMQSTWTGGDGAPVKVEGRAPHGRPDADEFPTAGESMLSPFPAFLSELGTPILTDFGGVGSNAFTFCSFQMSDAFQLVAGDVQYRPRDLALEPDTNAAIAQARTIINALKEYSKQQSVLELYLRRIVDRIRSVKALVSHHSLQLEQKKSLGGAYTTFSTPNLPAFQIVSGRTGQPPSGFPTGALDGQPAHRALRSPYMNLLLSPFEQPLSQSVFSVEGSQGAAVTRSLPCNTALVLQDATAALQPDQVTRGDLRDRLWTAQSLQTPNKAVSTASPSPLVMKAPLLWEKAACSERGKCFLPQEPAMGSQDVETDATASDRGSAATLPFSATPAKGTGALCPTPFQSPIRPGFRSKFRLENAPSVVTVRDATPPVGLPLRISSAGDVGVERRDASAMWPSGSAAYKSPTSSISSPFLHSTNLSTGEVDRERVEGTVFTAVLEDESGAAGRRPMVAVPPSDGKERRRSPEGRSLGAEADVGLKHAASLPSISGSFADRSPSDCILPPQQRMELSPAGAGEDPEHVDSEETAQLASVSRVRARLLRFPGRSFDGTTPSVCGGRSAGEAFSNSSPDAPALHRPRKLHPAEREVGADSHERLSGAGSKGDDSDLQLDAAHAARRPLAGELSRAPAFVDAATKTRRGEPCSDHEACVVGSNEVGVAGSAREQATGERHEFPEDVPLSSLLKLQVTNKSFSSFMSDPERSSLATPSVLGSSSIPLNLGGSGVERRRGRSSSNSNAQGQRKSVPQHSPSTSHSPRADGIPRRAAVESEAGGSAITRTREALPVGAVRGALDVNNSLSPKGRRSTVVICDDSTMPEGHSDHFRRDRAHSRSARNFSSTSGDGRSDGTSASAVCDSHQACVSNRPPQYDLPPIPSPQPLLPSLDYLNDDCKVLLGSGASGSVYAKVRVDTGMVVAVKEIFVSEESLKQVENEISVLWGLQPDGEALSEPLSTVREGTSTGAAEQDSSRTTKSGTAPNRETGGGSGSGDGRISSLSDSKRALVNCYGVFSDANTVHIVLEAMSGGSIRDLLEKRRSLAAEQGSSEGQVCRGLTEEECCAIAFQVLHGLQYLHDGRHQLHRDIKPHNVLFDKYTGCVKLTDFGISSRPVQSMGFNERSTYCGTLAYMSPSRVEAECSYGEESDLWSLGISLLEMANGSLPFRPHVFLVADFKSNPPRLPGYAELKKATADSSKEGNPVDPRSEVAEGQQKDAGGDLDENVRGESGLSSKRCSKKKKITQYSAQFHDFIACVLPAQPKQPKESTTRPRASWNQREGGVPPGSMYGSPPSPSLHDVCSGSPFRSGTALQQMMSPSRSVPSRSFMISPACDKSRILETTLQHLFTMKDEDEDEDADGRHSSGSSSFNSYESNSRFDIENQGMDDDDDDSCCSQSYQFLDGARERANPTDVEQHAQPLKEEERSLGAVEANTEADPSAISPTSGRGFMRLSQGSGGWLLNEAQFRDDQGRRPVRSMSAAVHPKVPGTPYSAGTQTHRRCPRSVMEGSLQQFPTFCDTKSAAWTSHAGLEKGGTSSPALRPAPLLGTSLRRSNTSALQAKTSTAIRSSADVKGLPTSSPFLTPLMRTSIPVCAALRECCFSSPEAAADASASPDFPGVFQTGMPSMNIAPRASMTTALQLPSRNNLEALGRSEPLERRTSAIGGAVKTNPMNASSSANEPSGLGVRSVDACTAGTPRNRSASGRPIISGGEANSASPLDASLRNSESNDRGPSRSISKCNAPVAPADCRSDVSAARPTNRSSRRSRCHGKADRGDTSVSVSSRTARTERPPSSTRNAGEALTAANLLRHPWFASMTWERSRWIVSRASR